MPNVLKADRKYVRARNCLVMSGTSCKLLLEHNVNPLELEPRVFFAWQPIKVFAVVRRLCQSKWAKPYKHLTMRIKGYYDELLQVLKQKPKFERKEVRCSHHVRLNETEKVAKLLAHFNKSGLISNKRLTKLLFLIFNWQKLHVLLILEDKTYWN